ncbi:MAG: dihydrodipicolinate synthase family protein [Chloroflexota bacterium]
MDKRQQTKWPRTAWTGVFAAIPTTFGPSEEIDHESLAKYVEWLLAHDSVRGIVCHAHAGEVTNLTPEEVAAVSKTVVTAARGRVPVVAGLLAEGVHPAAAIVRRLEKAGVDALLVMPPHHWLRFGKTIQESTSYFAGLAAVTRLPFIIHEYPSATRAGYTSEELVAFSHVENVVALKAGARNMAAYGAHIAALRREAPRMTILTCHDEAMLPTLVQGVDGVLVALASLIPEELHAMHQAVQHGDLATAQAIERQVAPIVGLMYGSDQPTGRSHALLKAALHVLGVLPNAVVRPPVQPVTEQELQAIARALDVSGLRRGAESATAIGTKAVGK